VFKQTLFHFFSQVQVANGLLYNLSIQSGIIYCHFLSFENKKSP
jgi:hypothetical protein